MSYGLSIRKIAVPGSLPSVVLFVDEDLGTARRLLRSSVGSDFRRSKATTEGTAPELMADPRKSESSLLFCTLGVLAVRDYLITRGKNTAYHPATADESIRARADGRACWRRASGREAYKGGTDGKRDLYDLKFNKLAKLLLVLLLIAGCSPLEEAMAANSKTASTFKTSFRDGQLVVEHCLGDQCRFPKIPEKLKQQVAEGFRIDVEDIDGDGGQELVSAGSGVNRCASFYRYKEGMLTEYMPTKQSICNHTSDQQHVFSKYRDGAIWYEAAYRKMAGRLVLEGVDRCIDCGEVYRMIYRNGIPADKQIVSDVPHFMDRTRMFATVTASKAFLFESPEQSSRTGMYLIAGDRVALVDYSDNGSGWYQVRFSRQGKADTVKWLVCEALDRCAAK